MNDSKKQRKGCPHPPQSTEEVRDCEFDEQTSNDGHRSGGAHLSDFAEESLSPPDKSDQAHVASYSGSILAEGSKK
jgi:hypothetical protein